MAQIDLFKRNIRRRHTSHSRVHRKPHRINPSKLARRDWKKIGLDLAKKIKAEPAPTRPTTAIKREREIIERNFFIFLDNCSFVSVFEVMRNCGFHVHGHIQCDREVGTGKTGDRGCSMDALRRACCKLFFHRSQSFLI